MEDHCHAKATNGHTESLNVSNDRSFLSPPSSPRTHASSSGVHKVIIKDGCGPTVPLHSTCLLRYAGRVLSTGEVFVDSRSGDLAQVVAGRDAIMKNKGLYEVVGTMRRGEICHAWIDASKGYGAEGNFSFPSVPPNAELVYAIELVDFEPPPRDTKDGFMTYEERLEAAKRRRLEGNEAFSKGEGSSTEEALKAYESALAFLDDDFMLQLYDFHYDKAMEEKMTVLLNMSACHLKLGKASAAAESAARVLAHDKNNTKALFRRGAARRQLGQTSDALEDLEKVRRLGGDDSRVGLEIARVREELRKEDKARVSLYTAMMTESREDDKGEHRESPEDRAQRPCEAPRRPWSEVGVSHMVIHMMTSIASCFSSLLLFVSSKCTRWLATGENRKEKSG
jgi:FKBP-type peptidyl-prolyl cis-trans isomerase